MNIDDMYIQLKEALKSEIVRHDLADKRIDIKCKPLSVEEAKIGRASCRERV